MAVIASMVGVGLIADWQSIGYDPCTKYSVFHNPELEHNVSSLVTELNLTTESVSSKSAWLNSSKCVQFNFNESLIQLKMQEAVKEIVPPVPQPIQVTGSGSGSGLKPEPELDCSYIRHENSPCLSCTAAKSDENPLACMSFRVNVNSSCYEVMNKKSTPANSQDANVTSLLCQSQFLPLSLCVSVHNVRFFSDAEVQDFKQATAILTSALVSNDQLYPEDVYASEQQQAEEFHWDPDVLTAKGICLESEDNCYWNQFSQVTKEDCYSCPQICRSVRKSLNFVQFAIGAAIFVIAIPISRVVLMILISDNLSQEQQVCACL